MHKIDRKSKIKQTMIIHYASDVHLEFFENADGTIIEGEYGKLLRLFPESRVTIAEGSNSISLESLDQHGQGHILVLAGDIGYPWRPIFADFIKHCCCHFDHVIYVTGNHEYYSKEHTMDQVDTLIKDIAEDLKISGINNFWPLMNSSVTISGIKFIGGTLFTYYPESKYTEVTKIMNDYNFYSPEEVSKRHRETAEYLYEQIFKPANAEIMAESEVTNTDLPLVVITHHLPSSMGLSLCHRHLSTNYLYANQLDFLLKHDSVYAWFSGHTHVPKIYGKLHIGPLGYPGELVKVVRKMILNARK